MGLYTEETYRIYGPQWKENLFYSHLLSLPLFLPFLPSLTKQFMKLANSAPLALPVPPLEDYPNLSPNIQQGLERIQIPNQLFYLVLNVLTQYACIRGVNLLAAASSALTVTIVLNIRKLVSLLLSIWLFGNRLASGTLVGACIVFFAGGSFSSAPSALSRALLRFDAPFIAIVSSGERESTIDIACRGPYKISVLGGERVEGITCGGMELDRAWALKM